MTSLLVPGTAVKVTVTIKVTKPGSVLRVAALSSSGGFSPRGVSALPAMATGKPTRVGAGDIPAGGRTGRAGGSGVSPAAISHEADFLAEKARGAGERLLTQTPPVGYFTIPRSY